MPGLMVLCAMRGNHQKSPVRVEEGDRTGAAPSPGRDIAKPKAARGETYLVRYPMQKVDECPRYM